MIKYNIDEVNNVRQKLYSLWKDRTLGKLLGSLINLFSHIDNLRPISYSIYVQYSVHNVHFYNCFTL